MERAAGMVDDVCDCAVVVGGTNDLPDHAVR
jgi:hypothetical protein